ncbi:MAG: Serine dehydrogenase proteinase, partial [Planctomycetota bacterium]
MNRFMHSFPVSKKFSTTTLATVALSLAVLTSGASMAVAADVKLANGSTWKGDAGARVRVTYTLNGKELTLEGVVVKADKSFLQVEVDENGKKVKKTITSFDLKKVETLAADGAASTKTTSGSSGGATPTKSNTTSGSTNAGGSATAAASGKQTIFILPWGRGPGGDVDMVGLGARHEEIEKIGTEADKIGPGQIIVLEVNSGGGLVLEGDKIDETLNKLRERHRVIAWIHEAISAAAFTSLHCNEIYFQRVGTLGAITMFSGTKAI